MHIWKKKQEFLIAKPNRGRKKQKLNLLQHNQGRKKQNLSEWEKRKQFIPIYAYLKEK